MQQRRWNNEAVAAVRELPSSSLSSALLSLGGYRFSWATVSAMLTQRMTIHVCVLVMVGIVAAGSVFSSHRLVESSRDEAVAASVAAPTAIVAHVIPLTSHGTDDMSTGYVVQAGETLKSIAGDANVSEEALLAFNGLNSADADYRWHDLASAGHWQIGVPVEVRYGPA